MMQYILYVFTAILPSAVWLFWYLRKDKHPEPKREVLKIFTWGMLIAFPAIIIENLAMEFLGNALIAPLLRDALLYIFGVALTEEAFKFFVVQFRVLKTAYLDEPVDAMVYMITAALGFAAIENVFLLTPLFREDFFPTLGLVFFRFIGATLLHALASAIIGYYLALALFRPQKRFPLLIHGFTLAVLLHGLYNILVVRTEEYFWFIIPTAFMMISAGIVVSSWFQKLSKMKPVTMPQDQRK